jgi:nucleoside-diphosphate-sugar epimerase
LIIKNIQGLNFVSLKPFDIYGFNEIKKKEMKSAIADMIISSLLHKKSQFGNLQVGSQSRDFTNMLDVNKIILKLIVSLRYMNKFFDLGSGQSYKFIDLANFITLKDSEIVIELTDPPIGYDRSYYQKYICANMSWLNVLYIGVRPSVPFKKIPELTQQYKKILKHGNMLELG